MFYFLIEKRIEKETVYKKLGDVDVFKLLKATRKYFVKDERFIN